MTLGAYHPLAAAALAGSATMAIFTNVNPADVVIFVVAGAAAFASYRSRKGEVVHRLNTDLNERNRFLENEHTRLNGVISNLESKVSALEQRPNIDSLTAVVDRLSTVVAAHDANSMRVAEDLHRVAEGQLKLLGEIAAAVIPPERLSD